jgi:heme-degrading monooxygenase HmoA
VEAIGGYVTGLWTSFPDLSFKIVSAGLVGNGVVAAQWVMQGTNHGPVLGLPPTGKCIELPGADFIRVSEGVIRSVEGYFDSKLFVEQIGLQAIVQPYTVGPYTFGTAVSVKTGKPTRPGAFSITSLHVRSEQEVDYVSNTSRQIVLEMQEMPGFISWVGLRIGDMMMTVTAWEQLEHIRLFMRNATHKRAVKDVFDPGVASSLMTSVWLPDRISAIVRCSTCDQLVHDRTEGRCVCGAQLPEPLAYW